MMTNQNIKTMLKTKANMKNDCRKYYLTVLCISQQSQHVYECFS